MTRSPFTGRASERERLTAAWARANAGDRQIALVAGEPGIGKTRLAAEVARVPSERGGIVLYGRCDEDLSAPFQPWVQALRHYVTHAAPDALRAELENHAPDLARILPELAPHRPDRLSAPSTDPESERLRLFDAMVAVLAAVSRGAPVLLVLDDLGWADKPSLVLLRHLARASRPAAVLVLGTYRETDLVQTHPLAETLADLRREPAGDRVLLGRIARDPLAHRGSLTPTAGRTPPAPPAGSGPAPRSRLDSAVSSGFSYECSSGPPSLRGWLVGNHHRRGWPGWTISWQFTSRGRPFGLPLS